MNRIHKHILAAGLLAGLGFGAIAQPAPQAPADGQQFAHRGEHGQMNPQRMEEMRARMEQRRAERLEFFKFKLKVTPAQEGAWNAWTAAMKPPAQRMARPDRAEFERLSTPERIDRMRALRATRQAEMDRRMDATKVFYASLNPDQKRLFDAESLRFLGGRRGGHHGGGFGGHRG